MGINFFIVHKFNKTHSNLVPNFTNTRIYSHLRFVQTIKKGYFCSTFTDMLTNGHITLTDPIFIKKEKHNAFERFWLKFINDERDLPFVRLSIKLLCIFPPMAVIIYFLSMNANTPWYLWWGVVAVYLFLDWAIFLGPFILMLHNTSHRSFFKHKYKKWNNFIPWIIGPFFGETPETYFAHHVAMHHPENNMEDDLSTTMPFRRDSVRGFLLYFSTFFFIGMGQLIGYHIKKKRTPIMWWMVVGEASFILLCVALSITLSFKATLVVLIIPLCFTRLMMMAGNWAQHAFVDAPAPGNCHRNSITCINTVYNKKSWNDGYHISHHLRPNRHWTDHPKEFLDNIDAYIKEDAIVFHTIDFTTVWLFLMLKKYKTLAKYYVVLDPNVKMTEEEIIAKLKYRTRRIEDRQYVTA